MLKNLRIRQENGTLLIEATREYSRWMALIGSLAAAGAISVFFYRFIGILPLVIVAVVIVAGSLYFGKKSEVAVLHITEREVRFTDCTISAKHVRTVGCEDIRWLEYQDDASGPESDHPGGLYAVLGKGSACLLADADSNQTHTVIDFIEATFPRLKERWKQQTPFGEHFTPLDLEK